MTELTERVVDELREENIRLKQSMQDRFRFGKMIGKSLKMQKIYELILQSAASDAHIIISGKSGTGKELAARAIHDHSDRKSYNFISVNCGAIPESLIESEFFGYRKGAFTGATIDKIGFLDSAHQGTLFLDEIGEIGLSMQVKLLRVMDGSGYSPLGSSEIVTPDIRIIAATNKDLKEFSIMLEFAHTWAI